MDSYSWKSSVTTMSDICCASHLTTIVVICHDQTILRGIINSAKYEDFANRLYVFVSNRDSDSIRYFPNVLICKDREFNIEEWPMLTAYTAWYCIRMNLDIRTPYITLLEYDTNYCSHNLHLSIDAMDRLKYQWMAYVKVPLTDINFLSVPYIAEPLISAINTLYGVDVKAFVRHLIDTRKEALWGATSNITWSTEEFIKFVDAFEAIRPLIQNNRYSGHMFERFIWIYNAINGNNGTVLGNTVRHLELNSHKTTNREIGVNDFLGAIVNNSW